MAILNRQQDEDIIKLVQTIMGNGTMVVETINESLLVKLMELRGTPIRYKSSLRDIDEDYAREMKDIESVKEYHHADARKETN